MYFQIFCFALVIFSRIHIAKMRNKDMTKEEYEKSGETLNEVIRENSQRQNIIFNSHIENIRNQRNIYS